MARIHWLGAGLSAVPGIRRLASQGRALTLWNRTLSKAQAALEGCGGNSKARELSWDALAEEVTRSDVVVSMLPAAMHLRVAEICLANQAHFVSSSYVSPGMQALHDRAASDGLCFLNEVGLDPGIDHLMAHALVHAYQQSSQFDKTNEHFFRSYCGGLSKEPNEFRYKFSWSPLGVLKALTNRSQWIADGQARSSEKVWESVADYAVALPSGATEMFQSYPNRDSLPYREEYGFAADWNLQEFVRGTLRLDGWSDAWREIFALVDTVSDEQRDAALASKSEELWQQHKLQEGEADRVVLVVELQAKKVGETVWHQRWIIDECGNERGTAMARLVSLTTSLGVESVLDGKIAKGVSAAVRDMDIVREWFDKLRSMGESIEHVQLV